MPLDAFLPCQWTVRFNRSDAHDPAAVMLTSAYFIHSSADAILQKAPACPSPASNLGAFAAVNIATMIATIFLCQKAATERDTSYLQQTLGIFFRTGLDLTAHGISAYQIRRVPGFSSVPIGGLILLWSCQPHIAWFDVFGLLEKLRGKKCYPKLAPTLGRELLMEIVALVYIRIATQHGDYRVKPSDPAIPSDAKLLYAGSVLWMVITVFCLAFSILGLVLLLMEDKSAYNGGERKCAGGFLVAMYAPCVGILYMATWIFWAGFIKLSGDL